MRATLLLALGVAAIAGSATLAGCEGSHAPPRPPANAPPTQGPEPIKIQVDYEDKDAPGLLQIPGDIIDRVVEAGAWRAGGSTATADVVKKAFDESCIYATFMYVELGGQEGSHGTAKSPSVEVVTHEGAATLVRETVSGARFESLDRGYRYHFRCDLAVGGGEKPARYTCLVDASGEVLDPAKPDDRRFRATWFGPLLPDAATATAIPGF